MEKRFITAKQYATETGIPIKWLYKKVEEGKLRTLERDPGGKIIFDLKDLEQDIESLKVKAQIEL